MFRFNDSYEYGLTLLVNCRKCVFVSGFCEKHYTNKIKIEMRKVKFSPKSCTCTVLEKEFTP